MRIQRIAAFGVACVFSAFSAGCARAPDKVLASYVSPVLYQSLTCDQLGQEAQRVSAAVATATGQQSEAATRDKVVTGVGIVVFWPALFFLKGDDATTAGLARLKGEMDAIEQTSIAKGCGIQFQRQAPVVAKAKPAESYPIAR